MPQNEAGTRIDPAPSVPTAIGPRPAATAAAAPPLEPPGVCPRLHGLRALPVRMESPVAFQPKSGAVVLPNTMAPAARTRSTTTASRDAGGLFLNRWLP